MCRVAASDSRWLRSGLHIVLAGIGGAGAALVSGTWVEAVTFTAVAVALALLVVVDQATFRLPDVIVGPTFLVLVTGLLVATVLSGEWARFGRAAAAAAVLLVGYFALAWINPAGLGLGDVKLAGVLGGVLGWFGWPHVMVGVLAGFLLSGAVGLVILITRQGGLKSEFPFGPWMILGATGGLMWAFMAGG
ncbi:MAG: prepilin peptidase [Actinomycetales bacterium]|nr:prepilin peptidase [Actinomycetales bacterium]